MGAQDQRPRFYEGQYLAADDLAAIVDYLRTADARHALGAHSWGIAAGLSLVERPAPGPQGRREVILTPGVAWDGHGRTLLVTRPTRLPEALFASIAYSPLDDEAGASGTPPSGRPVRVWITVNETATKPPARGFDNCEPADQNARVIEAVDFVIGEFAETARHGSVQIGTDAVAPREALRRYDPAAGELHDESVPQQTFPLAGRPPRWLVPIGYVRWIARDGELGYFAELDRVKEDRLVDCTRAFRRYLGVIAERVLGADGNVVIASRFAPPRARHGFQCLLNGPLGADARGDLAWIEGRLRVLGDLKLAGSKLQLRDADGQDQQVPMYVARHGDVTAAPPKGCCEDTAAASAAGPGTPPEAPRELRVALGALGQNAHKLFVGPQAPADPKAKDPAPTIAPRLVVTSGAGDRSDEGRVGVNTAEPAAAMEVKGDWQGEDGALRLSGKQPGLRFEGSGVWLAQADTEPASGLRIAYRMGDKDWRSLACFTSTLRVGIGTPTPRNRLGIRAQVPDSNDAATRDRYDELLSFEDRNGGAAWHLNLVKGAAGRSLNFAQTGAADARLFLQAGGRVGLGTSAPTNGLHLDRADGLRQRYLYMSGDAGWSSFSYNAHHDAGNVLWQYPDPTRASITIELDDERGARPRFEVYSRPAGGPSWRSHFRIHGGDAGSEVIAMARQGGRVGVGTDTPQRQLHVAGDAAVGGRLAVGATGLVDTLRVAGAFLRVDGLNDEQAYFGGDGSTGGAQAGGRDIQLGSANSQVQAVHLWNRGGFWMDLQCRGIWRTSEHNYSDAVLKHDVQPLRGALDAVTRLRGVSFRWRPESPGHRPGDARHFGVIAQEVAAVLPEAVSSSPHGLGVDYSALVPWLMEAIKELKAEVDALRGELATLRASAPRPGAKAPSAALKIKRKTAKPG
jgi:hypothetical protein